MSTPPPEPEQGQGQPEKTKEQKQLVTPLRTEQDLHEKLSASTKPVVLEFVKKDSRVCEYVKPERDIIAQEMEAKADFYELNVDTFKKFAETLQVEALPAFVVMKKFVKKRHVVGTDGLKTAIDYVIANFDAPDKPQGRSEQNQPDATAPTNPTCTVL